MTAPTPMPTSLPSSMSTSLPTSMPVSSSPARAGYAPAPGRGRVTADRSAGTVRRPSFARLAAVELRKSVDTRAGRFLLVAVAAVGLFAAGWLITHPEGPAAVFGQHVEATSIGLRLLLPVLGVLAMTSEWTQRTTLVTFTLTPRRGRVFAAKLVAAVVLAAVTALLVTAVAAGATLLSAAVNDQAVSWDQASSLVQGNVLAAVLGVVMGSAVGALLQHTASAITLYYVLPTAWATISFAVLGERSQWFDVWTALGRLAELDVTGHAGPTATAVGTWILLPLVLGTLRSLRRNVS